MRKLTKKDIKKGDILELGYEVEYGVYKSYKSTEKGLQEIHHSTARYFAENYTEYTKITKAEPYNHYTMIV